MLRTIGSVTGLVLLMVACGGGGNGGGGSLATYSIGGTVTGLTGSGLLLQTNFGDVVAVSAAGGFTFANRLGSGAGYAVTVRTQPSAPTQNCIVTNGSGTVGTGNITNVAVACSTVGKYTVGGTVTGLTGSGLVLEYYNGLMQTVPLPVTSAGPFTFSPGAVQGSSYQVYVGTQPTSPTQNCVLTGGAGLVGTANVSDISVVCSGVGRFAYATNAADNTISVYAIDSTTGALGTVGSPVPTGTSPYAIVGSPDSQHVYVVNQTSNNVSAYAVNATSGALTQIAGSPYPTGTDPQALAFDPTGSYLYVANTGTNNLSAYAVNASTGSLTPLPSATYATGSGPTAVSVDGAGKFVFVSNHGGSNDISVFAITAATGALAPVAGSPFPVNDNPVGNPHSLVFVDSPGLYGLYVSTFDAVIGAISGSVSHSAGAPSKRCCFVTSGVKKMNMLAITMVQARK